MLTPAQHVAVTKYRATSKGRAAMARYRASAKRAEVQKRYEATLNGRAVKKRIAARRLRIGGRYVGFARTVAEARAINAHIKEKLRGFVARQSART